MKSDYKQIKVMVTPQEYEQIQEKANAKALKLSGYVRSVLKIKNNLDIKKHNNYTPIDPNLLKELNKIGNNLNQVARLCNCQYDLDFHILTTLQLIEQKIKTLLEEILKQGVSNDNNI